MRCKQRTFLCVTFSMYKVYFILCVEQQNSRNFVPFFSSQFYIYEYNDATSDGNKVIVKSPYVTGRNVLCVPKRIKKNSHYFRMRYN